jgi:hypothetical protein
MPGISNWDLSLPTAGSPRCLTPSSLSTGHDNCNLHIVSHNFHRESLGLAASLLLRQGSSRSLTPRMFNPMQNKCCKISLQEIIYIQDVQAGPVRTPAQASKIFSNWKCRVNQSKIFPQSVGSVSATAVTPFLAPHLNCELHSLVQAKITP